MIALNEPPGCEHLEATANLHLEVQLAANADAPGVASPPPAGPTLPRFWEAGHDGDTATGEGNISPDAWKDLNPLSPSIQRDQYIWAYFRLPARKLTEKLRGQASICGRTDGFRSFIRVQSTLLTAPHDEDVKEVYFSAVRRALVFRTVQLAVDLDPAEDAFEKAKRLRDEQKLPSLLLVRNVPALRIDGAGALQPFGYVTIRKHKAFRGIVSLAPSHAMVYDVFDMIEGIELGIASGLFVIGTWILDLRPFASLTMLFRSELRNQGQGGGAPSLLPLAFETFRVMAEQQEVARNREIAAARLTAVDDEPTGSTALPINYELAQERATPNSGPNTDQLDEGIVSVQARSEGLHTACSPIDANSHPNDKQQPLRDDVVDSCETSEHQGRYLKVQPCSPSSFQSGHCSSNDSHPPTENVEHETPVDEKGQDATCLEAEATEAFKGAHRENQLLDGAVNQPPGRNESLVCLKDISTIHGAGNTSPGGNLQPYIAVALEQNTKSGDQESHEPRISLLEADASRRERGTPEEPTFRDGFDHLHKPEEASVGSIPAGEDPNELPRNYDEAIEEELQKWTTEEDQQAEVAESTSVSIPEESWYPAQEIEYWAVEDLLVTVEQNYESAEEGTLSLTCGAKVFLLSVTNTSWALCRTVDGALGYVPTVALSPTFMEISSRVKMFGRKTAYVDRQYRWKNVQFYPGDAVVILADRGRWVLVRDYFRPFRQAYIPRGRIRFPWQLQL